jgi:hypothetical protein
MSTTLYFTRQPPSANVPAMNPLVAVAWSRAYFVQRWRVAMNKPDISSQGSGKPFGGTAGTSAHWQFVSDPIAAGGNLSCAFKMVMEYSVTGTPELEIPLIDIRVIQPDGTPRGTFYRNTTDTAISVANTNFSRLFTGTGTTVAMQTGDRIVIELGWAATTTTVANVSSLLTAWSASESQSDLPYLKDVGGFGNPWIQFDTTLAFTPDYIPSVTRLYFSRAVPADPSIPVTVLPSSSWTRVLAGRLRQMLVRRKTDAVILTPFTVSTLGSTATGSLNFGQWFSDPLDRDQFISGTATVVLQGIEQVVTENSYLAAVVRVLTPLNTIRATLSTAIGQIGTEFGTLASDRKLALPLAPTTCFKGERLVVEVGVHSVTPSNTGFVGIQVGAYAPLSDAMGDESQTARLNGWVEFSQLVTFDSGTFLGVYDPVVGVDWPLNVVVGTFQELPTEYGGQLRRGYARNLLSGQRLGKRGWRCTAEFADGETLDQFLASIDAAPSASVPAGVRAGSKVVQLYSDALGGLRTQFPQLVRVDAGAATPYENPDPARRSNTGWALELGFRQV